MGAGLMCNLISICRLVKAGRGWECGRGGGPAQGFREGGGGFSIFDSGMREEVQHRGHGGTEDARRRREFRFQSSEFGVHGVAVSWAVRAWVSWARLGVQPRLGRWDAGGANEAGESV
jgi:hypothetical protein